MASPSTKKAIEILLALRNNTCASTTSLTSDPLIRPSLPLLNVLSLPFPPYNQKKIASLYDPISAREYYFERMLFATLYMHMNDYIELTSVSLNDVYPLVLSLHNYLLSGNALDPKNEVQCDKFLTYLKEGCKRDQLLTLTKINADKKDCHISFFENIDARRVTSSGNTSLTWLAAKAVGESIPSEKLNAVLSSEAKEIVWSTQPYQDKKRSYSSMLKTDEKKKIKKAKEDSDTNKEGPSLPKRPRTL